MTLDDTTRWHSVTLDVRRDSNRWHSVIGDALAANTRIRQSYLEISRALVNYDCMPNDNKTKRRNRRDGAAAVALPPELDRERAIDINQLSAIADFAVITIRQRMANGGDLPRWFRSGRSVRWRLGDVLDWRDARTVGKATP